MVTFDAATERATPARNAVRPARAPDDRSRPDSGIFTEPEVMLTMRPKPRAIIGSIAFWMSSIATTMLATTPSIICWRVSSRKSRNGGPALLLTRMSGSGQAANSAAWPSGGRDVGDDGVHLGAGRLADLRRGRLDLRGVAAVDHHLAAGFGERRTRRRGRARGSRRRRWPCGRQFRDPWRRPPCRTRFGGYQDARIAGAEEMRSRLRQKPMLAARAVQGLPSRRMASTDGHAGSPHCGRRRRGGAAA